jgi:hypothetical protein
VYLWNINLSVALPVVVITGVATVAYASASVMPFLDPFCPYTTPANRIIAAILVAISSASSQSRCAAYSAADYSYGITTKPKWLDRISLKIRDILKPTADRSSDTLPTDQEVLAPMDLVTSQILSWLITHCEDSRSVDTALQAIAGADHRLPQQPLVECGAGALSLQQLSSCSQLVISGQYRLKDLSLSALAIKYLRAYMLLVSGNTYCVYEDR